LKSVESFDPLQQTLKGAHSIEASAGTGKTFSITLLWLRMILEEDLNVENILVSTFTKAATAELKDRLLEILKEARRACDFLQAEKPHESKAFEAVQMARKKSPHKTPEDWRNQLDVAISCFDLAPIVTIHGFCDRLLRQNALELGCDPELELCADMEPLIKRVTEDFLMRHSDSTSISAEAALKVAKVVASESAIEADHIHTAIPFHQQAFEQLCDNIKADYDKYQKAWPAFARKMVEKFLQKCDFAEFDKSWPPTKPPAYFETMNELDPGTLEKLFQAKEMLISKEKAWGELVQKIREQLPQLKIEAGLRGYDDVLLSIRSALRDSQRNKNLISAVLDKYQAVIIDECQDSDAVQIEIFQKLFLASAESEKCFMVIGDPKQSIYRFRGADLSSYSGLTSSCSSAPDMTVNYRSDLRLVETLNDLYQNNMYFNSSNTDSPIHYVKVDAKARKSRIVDDQVKNDEACFWMISESTHRNVAQSEICRGVALECQRALSGSVQIEDRQSKQMRALEASDIAILASTSRQLNMVRQQLIHLGIPCQMAGKGGGSVYKSDEALDLQIWLDLLTVVDGGTGDSIRRLLAYASTPLSGELYGRLEALAEDPKTIAHQIQNLKFQAEELQKYGPLPVLLRHIHSHGVAELILKHSGGERMVTNWRQLATQLQSDWNQGHRKAGQLAHLYRRRLSDKSESEEEQLRLETDLPAVQLVTIHGSKGLEYPVVFCPFLWHVKSASSRSKDKIAAIKRSAEGSILDVQSSDHKTILKADLQQEDEESQRLLYVALTRARHRLILGFAPVKDGGAQHGNGAQQSALAQLLGLDKVAPDEMLAHLPQWPKLRPMERLGHVPNVKSSNDSMNLVEPPLVDAYHGSISRQVSFSALSKQEHQLYAYKDRDEDIHEVGEFKSPQPGLLAHVPEYGAALGNRIHNILEQYLGNGIDLETLIPADSLGATELKLAMESMLDGTIPLPSRSSPSPSLKAFAQKSISEMHFLFPLGECSPEVLSKGLLTLDIIKSQPLRVAWAEGIRWWSFSKLRGFLQGYIDLVVEYDSQWYIVDYKTNLLTGYGFAECEAAMLQGQYILQALIYALALHRHLRANLFRYQPEVHFGGMAYLFMRGLREGEGVWLEKLSGLDLERLDSIFSGGN
jgi:exodeoxyribonuclease V beta subunit